MEKIYASGETAQIDPPLLVFTNSYGEEVEVRKIPAGYDGDPMLNTIKRNSTVEQAV